MGMVSATAPVLMPQVNLNIGRDFPEAEVLVAGAERTFMAAPTHAVLPSQVSSSAIRWREIAFENKPYAGFPQSADIFADGTAVFVPLFGHTPGSVGLFVTTRTGKRYFFVGDAVWNRAALRHARPKFWIMGAIVDNDAQETGVALRQIAAVMKANPDLEVVPAHDAQAHDELGYFSLWWERVDPIVGEGTARDASKHHHSLLSVIVH